MHGGCFVPFNNLWVLMAGSHVSHILYYRAQLKLLSVNQWSWLAALQLILWCLLVLRVLVWSVHILFQRKITQHQGDWPGACLCQPYFALVPTKLCIRINANLIVIFLTFFLPVGLWRKWNNLGSSVTLQKGFVCLLIDFFTSLFLQKKILN